MSRTKDDEYPPEEASKRMKSALLGARIVGHVPMKAKPKAKKSVKKTKKKSKS